MSIHDGWFNTGDIARIDDDGFIYIVDRAKDMVLRGGENIYCSEVESALYEHPDVVEAAVFGVPDERLGENVAAAVVLRPGPRCPKGVGRHLGERIAKFKVPASVVPPGETPRNANGKFMKRELRRSSSAAPDADGWAATGSPSGQPVTRPPVSGSYVSANEGSTTTGSAAPTASRGAYRVDHGL